MKSNQFVQFVICVDLRSVALFIGFRSSLQK